MKYYKGNLHTHTTASDGAKNPDEAIEIYRAQGYDFLALTDHYVFRPGEMRDGMLLISGAEYDTGRDAREGIYHVVGLGMERDPGLDRENKLPAAEIISAVKAAGGTAVLAHPAWSLNRPEELEKLGFDATEIYNTVSGLPYSTRPYSGEIAEQLALDGFFPPLLAVDDTHYYTGDHCVSYIMVRSESLDEASILAAVRAGDFYATQGPEFEYRIDGDVVCVECSPVQSVFFNTNAVWTPDRVTHGSNVTRAVYTLKPYDRFVRIELADADGRRAWSSCILAAGRRGQ